MTRLPVDTVTSPPIDAFKRTSSASTLAAPPVSLDKQKSLVNDIDNFYNGLGELNKILIKQKSNFESLKLSILSQEIKNRAA